MFIGYPDKKNFSFSCSALKGIANLIKDLLNKNYDNILTARFQSDPIERNFSRYRQISSRRFLVSMTEMNNSEKLLALNSIIKEDEIFWEENVYTVNNTDEVTMDTKAFLTKSTPVCYLLTKHEK